MTRQPRRPRPCSHSAASTKVQQKAKPLPTPKNRRPSQSRKPSSRWSNRLNTAPAGAARQGHAGEQFATAGQCARPCDDGNGRTSERRKCQSKSCPQGWRRRGQQRPIARDARLNNPEPQYPMSRDDGEKRAGHPQCAGDGRGHRRLGGGGQEQRLSAAGHDGPQDRQPLEIHSCQTEQHGRRGLGKVTIIFKLRA